MKISVYELLGMVKDGKAPKEIKFNNNVYKYHDEVHEYCRHHYDNTYIGLDTDYCLFDILNDTVEIIEEEKEICHKCHKYPVEYNQTYCEFCLGISKLEEEKKIPGRVLNAEVFDVPKLNKMELSNIALTNKEDIKIIKDTLNEVLDYLKSKGE